MITYVTKHTIDSVEDFPAWNGAVDVIDKAVETNRIDELNDLIIEVINTTLHLTGEYPTTRQINNFIWFDADNYLDLWNDKEYQEEE